MKVMETMGTAKPIMVVDARAMKILTTRISEEPGNGQGRLARIEILTRL